MMSKNKVFVKAACFVAVLVSGFTANAQNKPDSSESVYYKEVKTFSEPFVRTLNRNEAATFSLPEADFIKQVDSVRGLLLGVLGRRRASLKTPFVKEQLIQINYYFDKLLMDYPVNYENYTGQPVPDAQALIARAQAHAGDLNNPALLNELMFRNYVHAFVTFAVQAELTKQVYQNADNRLLLAEFAIVNSWITDPKCRSFWQYDYLYDYITNCGIKGLVSLYQKFKTTCADTAYLHRVNALYRFEEKRRQGHIIRIYKTVGTYKLEMHLFLPDSLKARKRPVMVYFHPGDWKEGKPDWYFDDCKADAHRGWVSCAVEYRTYYREGSLPFDAVKDARSAIRWLRQHAAEYNIDTGKIVANGFDAGGELALACSLANRINENTDDTRVNPAPDLIMVTSAIYDLTDNYNAWIRSKLKDKGAVRYISPVHLVRKGMPPVLVIHGRKDTEADYQQARLFEKEMKDAGNEIAFHPIDGAGHLLWLDSKYAGEVQKTQSDFLAKYGLKR